MDVCKDYLNIEKKYDAIVIFDADNLASKNFLNEMNKKLCEGYKVVQGYLDSKNPNDTWITGSYSITFWTNNRMGQLARNNLGLSSQLGGTGFAIDTEVLKTLGWGATCLTEDLEFTCKLVLSGHKVGWAHDAVVYDEKPLTLSASWSQRRRWMQGYADVASRYFFKLIKKAIKERNFIPFDCAYYTIQPACFVVMGIYMVFGIVQLLVTLFSEIIRGNYFMNYFHTEINATVILVSLYGLFALLYIPFLLLIDKKISFRILCYYALSPIYAITWLPISVQGILNKDNKEWSHTAHTRSMDITDLEKVN